MAIIPVGKEPENIKRRISTLFPKLDSAYPDKVICGLQRDHKKWAETVTELYRALGYSSGTEFLEAYGYKVEKAKAGRHSNDFAEIIGELKRRYPKGSWFKTVTELEGANPDLAGKFKSLANNAPKVFGMSLRDYLVSEGVLVGRREAAQLRMQLDKEHVDEIVGILKERYSDMGNVPKSSMQLKNENSDLQIEWLSNIRKVYGMSPDEYLARLGLISKVSVSIKVPEICVYL